MEQMKDNDEIDELNSNGVQETDNNVFVDIPGIKEMHDYEMLVKNGTVRGSSTMGSIPVEMSQKSFMPVNNQNNQIIVRMTQKQDTYTSDENINETQKMHPFNTSGDNKTVNITPERQHKDHHNSKDFVLSDNPLSGTVSQKGDIIIDNRSESTFRKIQFMDNHDANLKDD